MMKKEKNFKIVSLPFLKKLNPSQLEKQRTAALLHCQTKIILMSTVNLKILKELCITL